jgi:hypothetical protein
MNLSKAVTHSIASEKKGRNEYFCVGAPSCLVEVSNTKQQLALVMSFTIHGFWSALPRRPLFPWHQSTTYKCQRCQRRR